MLALESEISNLKSLKMTLKPSSFGFRILIVSSDGSCRQDGKSFPGSESITLSIDSKIPGHSKYLSNKAIERKEWDTAKPTTSSVPDSYQPSVSLSTIAASFHAMELKGPPTIVRSKTLLGMFRKGPCWTLKQLAQGLNLHEKDILQQVKERCHYVRAGICARTWICKPEYRTPDMPMVPIGVVAAIHEI